MYILTVEFNGEDWELDSLEEGIDQAGGFVSQITEI